MKNSNLPQLRHNNLSLEREIQTVTPNTELSGKKHLSANEVPFDLSYGELAPFVRVVRPTRPSLTYERME